MCVWCHPQENSSRGDGSKGRQYATAGCQTCSCTADGSSSNGGNTVHADDIDAAYGPALHMHGWAGTHHADLRHMCMHTAQFMHVGSWRPHPLVMGGQEQETYVVADQELGGEATQHAQQGPAAIHHLRLPQERKRRAQVKSTMQQGVMSAGGQVCALATTRPLPCQRSNIMMICTAPCKLWHRDLMWCANKMHH